MFGDDSEGEDLTAIDHGIGGTYLKRSTTMSENIITKLLEVVQWEKSRLLVRISEDNEDIAHGPPHVNHQ